MDISNIINLGLFLLTAVSTIFAGFQLLQARKAKTEAEAAKEEAKQYSLEALAALQDVANNSSRTAGAVEGIDVSGARSADSLERLAMRPVPWRVEQVHPDVGDWQLFNGGNDSVISTSLTTKDPSELVWLASDFSMDQIKVWTPGEFELIEFTGHAMLAAPAVITVILGWRYADDPDDYPDRKWKAMIS